MTWARSSIFWKIKAFFSTLTVFFMPECEWEILDRLRESSSPGPMLLLLTQNDPQRIGPIRNPLSPMHLLQFTSFYSTLVVQQRPLYWYVLTCPGSPWVLYLSLSSIRASDPSNTLSDNIWLVFTCWPGLTQMTWSHVTLQGWGHLGVRSQRVVFVFFCRLIVILYSSFLEKWVLKPV